MTVTTALVQTLHRLNIQKSDLESQLRRGPMIVASAQQRVQDAERQLEELHARIRDLRMEADSKQLQMEEREAKIRHWSGQLNTVKENREYQALKDQIAAETKANEVLSDEILETLEELDQLTEKEEEAKEQLSKIRTECAEIEQRIADKKVQLEAELNRINAELAEEEKGLEGEIRREYMRMVKVRGDDAMAELDGDSCSGCNMTLTPHLLSQLTAGRPVLCVSCGRILYCPATR
ncbi:MAG: phospholipase [Planctomycetota bacterium]|nr:MAG: phospholipase [Planctomycetota bacterium]